MSISPPQQRPTDPTSALRLLDEALGFAYPAALRTAAELGIADQLAAGPRTPAQLAAATGTQAPHLYRVLRLLATRGVFEEDDQGRFHLNPPAGALRTDAPLSVRAAVVMVTSPSFWHSAQDLTTTLRDGQPAFERVFGAPFFDYLARDEAAAATFHRGMASFSDVVEQKAVEHYNPPSAGTVVDVGGGYGGLLLRMLRRQDGLRGVLFDRPEVVARHRLAALGADERWEVIGGDFFTEVPTGGDLYLLKHILHDWSDADCVQILRNCRRAMAPGGRVLVFESVIAPGNQHQTGKLLDLFMMMMLTGRERSEAEFAQLFAAADLRQVRVIPTPAPVSIIETAAREPEVTSR